MAWRRTHAGGEGVTDHSANTRVRRKTGITRCFAWYGCTTTLLFRPNAQPARTCYLRRRLTNTDIISVACRRINYNSRKKKEKKRTLPLNIQYWSYEKKLIPRTSFDNIDSRRSAKRGLKWSRGRNAVSHIRVHTHVRTYATRAGVRGAIGRAGGVSNKLTADISVVYPAPLPSGSTSRLRASGPARERSRGEADIQRARPRARAPVRERRLRPRGREIIFATYLQTE